MCKIINQLSLDYHLLRVYFPHTCTVMSDKCIQCVYTETSGKCVLGNACAGPHTWIRLAIITSHSHVKCHMSNRPSSLDPVWLSFTVAHHFLQNEISEAKIIWTLHVSQIVSTTTAVCGSEIVLATIEMKPGSVVWGRPTVRMQPNISYVWPHPVSFCPSELNPYRHQSHTLLHSQYT